MDHTVIRILKSVKAAISKNGIIAISAYWKKQQILPSYLSKR